VDKQKFPLPPTREGRGEGSAEVARFLKTACRCGSLAGVFVAAAQHVDLSPIPSPPTLTRRRRGDPLLQLAEVLPHFLSHPCYSWFPFYNCLSRLFMRASSDPAAPQPTTGRPPGAPCTLFFLTSTTRQRVMALAWDVSPGQWNATPGFHAPRIPPCHASPSLACASC